MNPLGPAIIVHDTINIIHANERALQLFECSLEDIVGQKIIDGVHDKDMRLLVELRLLRIRTKGPMDSINWFPFIRPNKTVFWCEVKTEKIIDGEYVGFWQSILKYRGED